MALALTNTRPLDVLPQYEERCRYIEVANRTIQDRDRGLAHHAHQPRRSNREPAMVKHRLATLDVAGQIEGMREPQLARGSHSQPRAGSR
jgi:hypothetical protein